MRDVLGPEEIRQLPDGARIWAQFYRDVERYEGRWHDPDIEQELIVRYDERFGAGVRWLYRPGAQHPIEMPIDLRGRVGRQRVFCHLGHDGFMEYPEGTFIALFADRAAAARNLAQRRAEFEGMFADMAAEIADTTASQLPVQSHRLARPGLTIVDQGTRLGVVAAAHAVALQVTRDPHDPGRVLISRATFDGSPADERQKAVTWPHDAAMVSMPAEGLEPLMDRLAAN